LSTGSLRKHDKFRSRILRSARDIVVYLPPGYEEQAQRRFPVLYLQDGQNLFDGATSYIPGMYWRVGETTDHLIAAGTIQPLIIVGIYNAGVRRVREYTPTNIPRIGGGQAGRYLRMLTEELMPFIETQYRVLSGPAHTGFGGSSLGGLLTLFAGLRFPHVFGRLAALSPSVWWGHQWIHEFAARADVSPRPRIWLDIGTQESARIVREVERLRNLLIEKGWTPEQDLHFEIIDRGEHNEAAWAQRVGPFLQFLFPAGDSAI
jgi:enterochelin esterase-like enzyme